MAFENAGVFFEQGAASPAKTTVGVGAASISTVAATEYGEGNLHKTVLTLTAVPLTLRDTEQGKGIKIYDFPEGRILILGSTGSIAVTTTSILANTLNASSTLSWGVGTTTQANGTVATTEQNILNASTATSSATINVAGTAGTGYGVLAPIDGTGTAIDAYLNIGVPTGTDIDADATVTVTGTITITWINLGDY